MREPDLYLDAAHLNQDGMVHKAQTVTDVILLRVAKLIRRTGIELVGVGILDENILQIAADSIVVQKLEELPAQLCRLLGRTLRKGRRHVG